MIQSLLIANRGEIVRRIIRTARFLPTGDGDQHGPHRAEVKGDIFQEPPRHGEGDHLQGGKGVLMATIGVAIAVIGNALFAFSQLQPDASIPARLLREAMIWGLLAVVLFYALRVERLPAATLGLRDMGWKNTVLPGLAAGAVLCAVAAVVVTIARNVFHIGADNHLVAMLAGMPWWMLLLLSLRAGVTEELLFRGYLLDRLERLSGRRWVGVTGSIALFTAMHFGGWQAGQLVLVALAGTLFTALYLWKRNIMICVIAHTIVDLAAALAVTASARP